jgi:Fic family protein
VTALEWALKELANLPVSLRLVRELHKRLMADVRGGDKTPGEFRRFGNFVAPKGAPIERATFVPPPPGAAMEAALDDWERFLHESDEVPLLVRCALMHYQFETIHPFSDGNGRLGRLLIPLLLLERKAISQPLLYVSAYLERNRDEYYEVLTTGRTRGDVIPWVRLFLNAVEAQAIDATRRADMLSELRDRYQERFQKSKSTILRPLIDMLFQSLAVTVPAVAKIFDVTFPTAQSAVEELLAAGILCETTGQKRSRAYLAREILSIIMPEEAQDPAREVRESAEVTVADS